MDNERHSSDNTTDDEIAQRSQAMTPAAQVKETWNVIREEWPMSEAHTADELRSRLQHDQSPEMQRALSDFLKERGCEPGAGREPARDGYSRPVPHQGEAERVMSDIPNPEQEIDATLASLRPRTVLDRVSDLIAAAGRVVRGDVHPLSANERAEERILARDDRQADKQTIREKLNGHDALEPDEKLRPRLTVQQRDEIRERNGGYMPRQVSAQEGMRPADRMAHTMGTAQHTAEPKLPLMAPPMRAPNDPERNDQEIDLALRSLLHIKDDEIHESIVDQSRRKAAQNEDADQTRERPRRREQERW